MLPPHKVHFNAFFDSEKAIMTANELTQKLEQQVSEETSLISTAVDGNTYTLVVRGFSSSDIVDSKEFELSVDPHFIWIDAQGETVGEPFFSIEDDYITAFDVLEEVHAHYEMDDLTIAVSQEDIFQAANEVGLLLNRDQVDSVMSSVYNHLVLSIQDKAKDLLQSQRQHDERILEGMANIKTTSNKETASIKPPSFTG